MSLRPTPSSLTGIPGRRKSRLYQIQATQVRPAFRLLGREDASASSSFIFNYTQCNTQVCLPSRFPMRQAGVESAERTHTHRMNWREAACMHNPGGMPAGRRGNYQYDTAKFTQTATGRSPPCARDFGAKFGLARGALKRRACCRRWLLERTVARTRLPDFLGSRERSARPPAPRQPARKSQSQRSSPPNPRTSRPPAKTSGKPARADWTPVGRLRAEGYFRSCFRACPRAV